LLISKLHVYHIDDDLRSSLITLEVDPAFVESSRIRLQGNGSSIPCDSKSALAGFTRHCTDRLIGGKKSAQNLTDLADDSPNGIKMFDFNNS
jgi:hypothetical protein